MKTNIIKIAMYFAIISIINFITMSNTYAKFTNENAGSELSRIGKWEIQLDGKNINTEELEFNIFDTILNTDGSQEKNVLKKTSEKIIAPGTMGKFTMLIENKSDVSAKYKLEYTIIFSESSLKIPLKFGKDINGDGIADFWTNDISEISDQYKILEANQKDNTDEIWWKWEFDGDDNLDTNLGTEGKAEVTVSAKILAEQVI